jgi:hypothetical protein
MHLHEYGDSINLALLTKNKVLLTLLTILERFVTVVDSLKRCGQTTWRVSDITILGNL